MADSLDPVASRPAAASGPAAEGRSTPTPAELKLLAAQFEAMLMGQMLKQMQSSMFDDDEADTGFAKGPLAEAMYSELSLALSRAGGFGLGDAMTSPLLRQAGESDSTGRMGLAGLDLPQIGLLPEAVPLNRETIGPTLPIRSVEPAGLVSAGAVSSGFGWRSDPISGQLKFHKGADLPMPEGQEVPVAETGRVTFAGRQSGYGLTVMVEHRPGLVTRYAHLSEVTVAAGDQVASGQTIAKSGSSGRVTGPHLHFEVIENGQPVDPSERLTRLRTSVQATD